MDCVAVTMHPSGPSTPPVSSQRVFVDPVGSCARQAIGAMLVADDAATTGLRDVQPPRGVITITKSVGARAGYRIGRASGPLTPRVAVCRKQKWDSIGRLPNTLRTLRAVSAPSTRCGTNVRTARLVERLGFQREGI